MKNNNKALLTAAAVIALSSGFSSGAHAFDSVNWSWDKTITENVTKDVKVAIDNTPSGMLELEKLQAHIGDLSATSTISNVSNTPPTDGGEVSGGTIHVNIPVNLEAQYDANQAGNPVTGVTINSPGFTDGNASGFVDENDTHAHLAFDLNGDVAFQPGDVTITPTTAFDGVDLPSIESAATAVANNQSIASDVSMDLHDAQFLYGGYGEGAGSQMTGLDTSGVSNNLATNAAAYLTLAGALGGITPATITATSDVSAITNASVDSAATAVGNNADLTLTAATSDDAVFMGDITQYAYADVTAASSVSDVSVGNYANLDALTGPMVKSVATAVGNNLSLKVTGPQL